MDKQENKTYIICKNTKVYDYEDRHLIKKGCTIDRKSSIVISKHNNLEQCLLNFKQYKTEISRNIPNIMQFTVSEYYIEEWEAFSNLGIKYTTDVEIDIRKNEGKYLNTFNSFIEAEEYISKLYKESTDIIDDIYMAY